MPVTNVYDFNTRYTDVSVGFAMEAGKTLRASLARIEHCLGQLTDAQVWWRANAHMNAIGNLLLHLTGNLEQWVLAPIEQRRTTRNRPMEFSERSPIPKGELQENLRLAVEKAAAAIETLTTPEGLLRHCEIARTVESYETDLLAVVFHAVVHFEGHAQEIIAMTRQIRGDAYAFQWTPSVTQKKSGG